MADAGNFGGSVPERKRNTVLVSYTHLDVYKRQVVSKGLRSREMADAGNFGGSVPERKRNTVLLQPL
ncbi:hypothetical protein [Escherichia coli]|uniref:hypothetical protein n=1 Tax=Escherichia coli TaxID=562 RepID=UPI0018681BCB|nr:hypothetical protein [Escherichia coli]